jgi:GDP-L-fucose synthase
MSKRSSVIPERILVTGGRGMVGRNLLDILKEAYPQATLLHPTSSDLNLLNAEAVQAYCKDNSPDTIIHCAGKVGGIQANMADMPGFLNQNLMMGMNLLNASADLGIPRVLNLGSSCMYPRDVEGKLSEDMILTGQLEPTNEGYAIAKVTVAKYAEYLTNHHDHLQYKTLIPCNLFGAFDNFHPQRSHMIPAVIRKIDEAVNSKSDSVEIWGDGTARREFMDARDLANAIVFSLSHIEQLPPYLNVGLGHDYSVLEYYDTIAKALGYTGGFHFDTSKPVGMTRKLTDVSAINALGWTANISLEQGIQHAYQFYKEYLLSPLHKGEG